MNKINLVVTTISSRRSFLTKFHIVFTISLFCQLLLTFNIKAQANDYFLKAVAEFNKGNYVLADSLFTISNKLEPNKDTYYNRALCRGKLSDKNGFCSDIAYSSRHGDDFSTKTFLKKCGTIDTIFKPLVDKNNKPMKIVSRSLIYTYSDTIRIVFFDKYNGQVSDTTNIKKELNVNDKSNLENADVFIIVESAPEPPGGLIGFYQFVNKNLIIPNTVIKNKISGKVTLRIIITEDGTVKNIEVVKGIPGCPECDLEAKRILAISEKWKPGYMYGKKVKCYFTLPISFNYAKY